MLGLFNGMLIVVFLVKVCELCVELENRGVGGRGCCGLLLYFEDGVFGLGLLLILVGL